MFTTHSCSVMQYTEGNQEKHLWPLCFNLVYIRTEVFSFADLPLSTARHHTSEIKLFSISFAVLREDWYSSTVFPYRSLFYGDLPVQIKREATGMKWGHQRCWDASKGLGHKSRAFFQPSITLSILLCLMHARMQHQDILQ